MFLAAKLGDTFGFSKLVSHCQLFFVGGGARGEDLAPAP